MISALYGPLQHGVQRLAHEGFNSRSGPPEWGMAWEGAHERSVPRRAERRGPSQAMFKSRPVYGSWVFFQKRQWALEVGRTTPGTPRANHQEFFKPVTSLPPPHPHERELGLHLNRPDCNSMGTTTRPREGCRGIIQTILFAKKMPEGYAN
jgi:hypothetical protein